MPNCSKAMIGKLSKSESLRTVIEYVLKNDHSRLIACEGILVGDYHNEEWLEQMISDFEDQTLLHEPVAKAAGHISLSFHPNDAPQMTDFRMVKIAREYMQCMGIDNTQYVIVRHTNTAHPHLHIVYNRICNDGKLIPDRNERFRNVRFCKALSFKYGLTLGERQK